MTLASFESKYIDGEHSPEHINSSFIVLESQEAQTADFMKPGSCNENAAGVVRYFSLASTISSARNSGIGAPMGSLQISEDEDEDAAESDDEEMDQQHAGNDASAELYNSGSGTKMTAFSCSGEKHFERKKSTDLTSNEDRKSGCTNISANSCKAHVINTNENFPPSALKKPSSAALSVKRNSETSGDSDLSEVCDLVTTATVSAKCLKNVVDRRVTFPEFAIERSASGASSKDVRRRSVAVQTSREYGCCLPKCTKDKPYSALQHASSSDFCELSQRSPRGFTKFKSFPSARGATPNSIAAVDSSYQISLILQQNKERAERRCIIAAGQQQQQPEIQPEAPARMRCSKWSIFNFRRRSRK